MHFQSALRIVAKSIHQTTPPFNKTIAPRTRKASDAFLWFGHFCPTRVDWALLLQARRLGTLARLIAKESVKSYSPTNKAKSVHSASLRLFLWARIVIRDGVIGSTLRRVDSSAVDGQCCLVHGLG